MNNISHSHHILIFFRCQYEYEILFTLFDKKEKTLYTDNHIIHKGMVIIIGKYEDKGAKTEALHRKEKQNYRGRIPTHV